MKALHIFPFFGKNLVTGSEIHEYILTKELVKLGIEIDVFTTCSKKVNPLAAFSIKWDNEYPEGLEKTDGINIYRFKNTLSVPKIIGQVLSKLVINRWIKEENRYGIMVKGSPNLIDYYYLRTISRPVIYDWLTMLGRGPNSFSLLYRVLKTIKNYDVILVGFVPFALIWQLTFICKLFKKPVVILALFHPEDLSHHFKAFYWCFSVASGILAQTPYSLKLFKQYFPGSTPIEVGPGVDTASFGDNKVSGDRFRSKYGLKGKKLVLFVGRKEPSKRYDIAIEAVDLINDNRIKLVIIGKDIDKKVISSPNTIYLGEIPKADLMDAYDACDVFLLPSEYESFGMVFLEAWMRKKPVIGNSFCKPVASIIQDGEDGYLCASPEKIAYRLAQLICNPTLAKEMGEKGYKKTISRYTWQVIARKVYDFYYKITSRQ